jgi:hypothetical protein
MGKIEIDARQKDILVDNPLFLDGLSRTGKMFIGRIISALKNIEHIQYLPILEQIPYLYRLNAINKAAALALMRVSLDNFVYDFSIGRNFNLRPGDTTSVWSSTQPQKYLNKSFNNCGNAALQQIKKKNTRYLFAIHEVFPDIGLCLEAFPKAQVIHVVRHPVDIINSWYARGWPSRIGKDPLSFTPALKGRLGAIPWFAYQWMKDYEAMSDMDKTIKSVHSVITMGKAAYTSLAGKDKKRILFICFERVTHSPTAEINRICKFLDTKTTPYLKAVLKQERCPRITPLAERNAKYKNIVRKASKKAINLVTELINDYEDQNYHGYEL